MVAAAVLMVTVLYVPIFSLPASAAVADWQKGVDVTSISPDDFSSQSFQQTVQKIKGLGANYVNLVVQYYQSNDGSTDIGPGWNTPTDTALVSAIQYIHSQGLHVSLAPHLDTYSGDWRANINPGDRDTWYKNYGAMLTHLATIGAQNGVEEICLGTEMIDMSSALVNPDNTVRWQTMIQNVRGIFSGKLTYSANWGSGHDWVNEVEHINFWPSLDYIGISAYYDLSDLQSGWNSVKSEYLDPIEAKWNKPILFAETGYKSVQWSYTQPWNSGLGGNYSGDDQANAYNYMFSFWNNYSYMQGVNLWVSTTDPNAGQPGDTDYLFLNKPAAQVITQWWGGGSAGSEPPPSQPPTQPPSQPPTNPPPSQNTGTISASVTGNANPQVGTASTFTINVTNTGQASGAVVDVEIYTSAGAQAFQQFFDNQTISSSQPGSYQVSWTPPSPDSYRIKVGVFNGSWSQNYYWGDDVFDFSAATTPPPPANPTINVWWPTTGSPVTGIQPFKAMVPGLDVSQYSLYWQVDGDVLNKMDDSATDYPHKEAIVDLTNWNWQPTNSYQLNFVAKDLSGTTIAQQGVTITVPH